MLVLPISAKWFDMILCGIKKEEYREIKPYYTSRFKTIGLLDRYGLPTVMKTSIILRNGYSSTSRQSIVEVSLDIKKGREEWGAILGQEYYCLRIEDIHICREELMYMETRLHRAKSKQTNSWVKGYIWIGSSEVYMTPYNLGVAYYEDIQRLQCAAHEVDRSTLCMCTGKRDNHDNLIYEKDILRQFADIDELGNSLYFYYVVHWDEDSAAFVGCEICSSEEVSMLDLDDSEIIGNVIDNPELLKGDREVYERIENSNISHTEQI